MRLLIPAMAVLAACASGGHGAPPGGGAGGGGPVKMAGRSADAQDADLQDADLQDAEILADSGVGDTTTFSCVLAGDAGGPAACIELDPGSADAGSPCADAGAGPVMIGPCPRASSSGGCHLAQTATTGYTIWWYAPLGVGAVLTRCEQMGASYLSP